VLLLLCPPNDKPTFKLLFCDSNRYRIDRLAVSDGVVPQQPFDRGPVAHAHRDREPVVFRDHAQYLHRLRRFKETGAGELQGRRRLSALPNEPWRKQDVPDG
jgi:hypothetical protein